MNEINAGPKRRIGRTRFLLEFFIAAAFIKAGASGFGVVFTVLIGIGFLIALWASVRRLRDIKRSEWWVLIWIAILPFGFILGFTGIDVTANADVKAFGIAYFIVYVLWLSVLIFWPSAFPKNAITPTEKHLGVDENEPIAAVLRTNVGDSVHIGSEDITHINRLNGWQRIGVVFSALWCIVAIGLSINDYYNAYSNYSYHIESDADSAACRDNARKGPSPEENLKACPISETEVTGRQAIKPLLPPLLPLLALLFLPIAAGWLIAFIVIWATKWIREGFKAK